VQLIIIIGYRREVGFVSRVSERESYCLCLSGGALASECVPSGSMCRGPYRVIPQVSTEQIACCGPPTEINIPVLRSLLLQ